VSATALALRSPSRPWLRQLGLFLVAYTAYSLGRWLATGETVDAVDNAHAIVALQADLGLGVEDAVQTALTGTAWMWLLNHLYLAAQFVVLPGALVWLWRHSPDVYRRLRDTVLATWLLSVPVFAIFPVAPPRLAGIGMVDTISSSTGVALDSRFATALYNPLAAVPSLHAGFAFAVSVALVVALRRPVARWLAAAWTPVVGLSVVATGNHYLFDIAAGIAITILGGLVALRMRDEAPSAPARRRTGGPQTARGPA
jgi:membrane-associated phospholipid phosphatase